MSDGWGIGEVWLLRTAVGGGLLLFGSWFVMRWTRQPARQQRLGEWGMAAALVLAILSFGPTWFPVPLPGWLSLATDVPGGEIGVSPDAGERFAEGILLPTAGADTFPSETHVGLALFPGQAGLDPNEPDEATDLHSLGYSVRGALLNTILLLEYI
jgi:hypothetical protein